MPGQYIEPLQQSLGIITPEYLIAQNQQRAQEQFAQAQQAPTGAQAGAQSTGLAIGNLLGKAFESHQAKRGNYTPEMQAAMDNKKVYDEMKDIIKNADDPQKGLVEALVHGAKGGFTQAIPLLQAIQQQEQANQKSQLDMDKTASDIQVSQDRLELDRRKQANDAPTTVEVGAGGDMRQKMAYNPKTKAFDIPVGSPYKSGGQTINVGGQAGLQEKFQETELGDFSDRIKAIRSNAEEASAALPRIQNMASAFERLDSLGQGPAQALVNGMRSTLSQLTGKDLGSADAATVRSEGFSFALGMAAKIKPVSNTDIDNILKSLPGLNNTKFANRALAISMRATANATIDQRKAAEKWIAMQTKAGRVPSQPDANGNTFADFMGNQMGNKDYMTADERKFLADAVKSTTGSARKEPQVVSPEVGDFLKKRGL